MTIGAVGRGQDRLVSERVPPIYSGLLTTCTLTRAIVQRDTKLDMATHRARPLGSSVGEAPAQHTGHCRRDLERDCQGRTGTPGSRVFLTWLRSHDLYGARC